MSKHLSQQLLSTVMMAGAAAVPIVTTAAIIDQSLSGNGAAATSTAPVAALLRSSSAAGGTTTSAGRGTYQGPVVQQPYGAVQAAVSIKSGKITGVSISAPQNNSRSASINSQAVPLLRQETLQAQSANVNAISGATLTSEAYVQSLQGALTQARQGGSAAVAGQSGPTSIANGRKLSVHAQGDD